MTGSIVFFILAFLLGLPEDVHAFENKFEGRIWGSGQYYFGVPGAYKDVERDTQFRLSALGNALQKDEWKLDYELTGDARSVDGPSVQTRFNKDFDADFFRAWFRLGNDKFKLVGGRQKILFGAGSLFRPLGFFDTRNIAGIVPLTRGMDGVLSNYFFDETTLVEGWAVPAKKDDKVIVGFRGERLFEGWETGIVFQYHPPTDQVDLPNFNLDLTQAGFHIKGEHVAGFWNESRLDIEQKAGKRPLKFDSVLGADYTFSLGAGLHVLGEYFVSVREKEFTWVDRLNQLNIHQLGFLLDQPVGIAVVWRLFGFYDLKDGSTQIAPQIEYAFTNQIFIYLHGRWGGNVNGNDDPGRLFFKSPVFTGLEPNAGVTVVAYF